MAKATAKTSTPSAKKAAPAKSKTTAKTTDIIFKVSEDTLKKLKSLGIDPQLQSELEWCLGSYKHDKNPVGLLEMIQRSLLIFKGELAKKTKGVTAKLIGDLEKTLASK